MQSERDANKSQQDAWLHFNGNGVQGNGGHSTTIQGIWTKQICSTSCISSAHKQDIRLDKRTTELSVIKAKEGDYEGIM